MTCITIAGFGRTFAAKRNTLLACFQAIDPVHKQSSTPVISLYIKPLRSADPDITLVADPPRNAMIMGRINDSQAPLYVTAMSYRGLIDAAVLPIVLVRRAAHANGAGGPSS
jgi:hypothetical protein